MLSIHGFCVNNNSKITLTHAILSVIAEWFESVSNSCAVAELCVTMRASRQWVSNHRLLPEALTDHYARVVNSIQTTTARCNNSDGNWPRSWSLAKCHNGQTADQYFIGESYKSHPQAEWKGTWFTPCPSRLNTFCRRTIIISCNNKHCNLILTSTYYYYYYSKDPEG